MKKPKRCVTCGATVAHFCPPHRILVCPCGGEVVLGGEPAPRYTCKACGRVVASLFDGLVPSGEGVRRP